MNYTNTTGISLTMAVFLAYDDYDYMPNTISATSLMKSTRQYILSKRIPPSERITDISTLVASSMGTAIHSGIEKAWGSKNLPKIVKNLGYPEKVANNIKVNPSEEDIKNNPDIIPVYQEIRSSMEILGFTVTGKFDFVGEGMVQDFKSTSVWTYVYQSKLEDFITQLSIYKLLNPDKITKSVAQIHYIFTDWSKAAATKKEYPPSKVLTQNVTLWDDDVTRKYIEKKLTAIITHTHSAQSSIPLCTDKELWKTSGTWKYYKDPTKLKRSTRNFDNATEASQMLVKDGNVGIVVHVPAQAKACHYCPAYSICEQAEALIESGELTPL